MNNLTLGRTRFTYYETLGGGQGACPDADGPSGVHVAMSNTLNTPVEALELEFPLRVVAYALRRGSGGAGRHRGGDGVVRELEALAEMEFSLLTERRRHAPPGADGRRARRAAGATCSTARSCRPRRAVACGPVSDCGSRPREVAAMGEPVGFVGLGIMGSRMAANLRRAGHEVTVYNRTRATAEAWVAEHGGRVAATPREAAEGAAAVITMVVDGAAGRGRCCSATDGAAHGAAPGTLFVDMSTIAPADARRDRRRARRARSSPSSTRRSPAPRPRREDGTLTIMAGGDEADFARARPLFEAMGELILHVGAARPRPDGQGDQQRRRRRQLRDARPGAGGRQGHRRRPRGAGRGDRRGLGGLDDARAQGGADARARLHAAVQARAHAQGRPPLPGGERGGGRAVPRGGARARALRRRDGPRARRAGLRRGARGRRGAGRESGSDTASARRLYASKSRSICRQILGSRSFVHSM